MSDVAILNRLVTSGMINVFPNSRETATLGIFKIRLRLRRLVHATQVLVLVALQAFLLNRQNQDQARW